MFNLIYNDFKDDGVPIKNGGRSVSRLYHDLKNLYFNFSISTIDKLVPTIPSLYPLELENLDFEKSVSSIPNDSQKIIIESKIPVLVYFPTEGFSLFERNLWLHRLLYDFHACGFANNQIILIYGNLRIKDQYFKFLESLKTKECRDLLALRFNLPDDFFSYHYDNFRCFDINYFEKKYFNDYFEYANKFKKIKKFMVTEKQIFRRANKKVDFLSYNRHPRYNRLAFIYSLFEKKLIGNCYLSCIARDESLVCKINEQSIIDASRLTDDSPEKLAEFFHKLPNRHIPYEEKDSHNLINFTNKNQFIDSWYSIVTETEISNDSIFLTEKTYKPILNLHPFVIWGNPFSLAYLRSIGYKTFPNMFDEAYDLEIDPKVRLSMIIEQISNFKKLSNEEKLHRLRLDKDNIIHNRKHFLTRGDYALQGTLKNVFLEIFPNNRKLRKRLITYISKLS